jgi:hypothetical protein
MSDWGWRRWTGTLGIAYVAMQMAGVVLFVVAGNPPRFDDAKSYAGFISSGSGLFLGDAVLTAVATTVLLLVAAGIRRAMLTAGQDWEWSAALSFGAVLVLAALAFTGAALEATTALVSTTGTDPMTVRTSWVVTSFVFTFIYLPSALFLATVSYTVLRTAVLAGWVGWLGAICAILNLGAVLTAFGGTGSYGPLGLLPLILGFAPGALWVFGISLAVLRARSSVEGRGSSLPRSPSPSASV